MRQRVFARALLGLCVLVALAGCESLGLAQPGGFNDRLAYATGVHTSVVQTATNALQAHEISSAQADEILAIAEDSRHALDAARIAGQAGDMSTAEGRLQFTVAALTALQTFLRTRDASSLEVARANIERAKGDEL